MSYDAILLVSFGGPEGHDDVMPFLQKVTGGRVPAARLEEVAKHYHHFGGVSPINRQNRELMTALELELTQAGINLPVYFGNRHWHPFLADTLELMAKNGVRKALAFVTSAYSSYSGCRAYLDEISTARQSIGGNAPEIEKIRGFFNHPLFVEVNASNLREALNKFVGEQVEVVFTAHSIPAAMAEACKYESQLRETCKLVAESANATKWQLAFQSRSGNPSQPWLEPDILDVLGTLHAQGLKNVIVHPIGFLSDHMEVMYDLDIQAKEKADELSMKMIRVPTPGTHASFVRMIRELIEERLLGAQRRSIGSMAMCGDSCATDCCPSLASHTVPQSKEQPR